ncbi:MAG: hypothetical protein ACP5NB_13005, partial [Chloroflexia bacterium]
EGFYAPGNHRLDRAFGSLEAGRVLTWTFAVRVGTEAGWEGGVPLTLSARGEETPQAAWGTAVVYVPYPLPDGPAESVLRPGKGGEVVSPDGRVRLVFPPEAVPVTLTVRYRPPVAALLSGGHPSGRAAPPSQEAAFLRPLRRFAVEVQDGSGKAVSAFPAPVEISYRYTWAEALGRDEEGFFLARWDEGSGIWVRLPTEVDREGRTLRARTSRLSEVLAGDGYIKLPSDDYLPSLQGFQEIDLFSGAASYSYPIELPPGRGGLTPRLALSYSSGGVDWPARAWDADVQASWVGYGWSLEVGSIGRQDVGGFRVDPATCEQTGSQFSHGDVWSLSLNGAGYDLVLGQDGYYHTAEESFFRIWNSGGGDPSAWYVKTKDGTLYTFGQRLRQVVCSGPCDQNPPQWDYQAYKWLLTEVRDVHNNTITYEYTVVPGETCLQRPTERAAYLSRILYNGGLMRVDFILGSRADLYAPMEDTRCPSRFLQSQKLNEIRVYVQGTLAWRYSFTYDYSTYDDHLGDGVNKGKLTLKKVQKCAPDGANWLCLPETVFEYYPLGTLQNPQVGRNRLKSVSNGYGGKVTFTYQVVSEIPGGWRNRVVQRQVEDGLGNIYTWTYTYSAAARNTPNKAGVCVGNSDDAATEYPRTRQGQEFRGHAWVQVTDPLGNVQVHSFHQDDTFKGKEMGVQYKDGSGVLLRQVVNTYAYEAFPVASYQGGATWAEPEVAFTYLALEQDRAYRSNGTYQEKKTAYGYDVGMQGGAQYGNLTTIREYDGGGNLYRTTRRWYCPNAGLWLVDRMNAEGVWEGDWGATASATWYYYDQEESHLTCPQSKGELKRVVRLQYNRTEGGWIYWDTAETAYTYDPYGNRTSETAYAGYGQVWQYVITPTIILRQAWPNLPRTTQIDYNFSGSGFYLYPERVVYPISALEERASYDYRLGVLSSHTDFNGDTTSWQYDALGRVVKVYRPGDVADYPSVQVDYLFFGTVGQQRVVVYRRTESAPGGEWIWEERFFDGLGRLVQVHGRWEGDGYLNDEVRKSTSYDAFGRVKVEWVPYYGDHGQDGGYGMYGYVPPDPGGARTQTVYDALGRVYNVTHPDGTVVK